MKSVLKWLCTGDLHCAPFKPFSTILPNGMNSRLANCLKVFDILKAECKARKIDKVLLNGDIFNQSDLQETETYKAVFEKVEELHEAGIEVVINVGNHDVVRMDGEKLVHCLSPFRKVARVISLPTLVWGRILVIPHTEPPKRLLEAIRPVKTKPSVLVLHVGVQGAKTGPKGYLVNNPIKLEDIHADKFSLVLLSDYHTSQWLSNNVLYMGSPLHHNFGEIHNPAVWEVRLYEEKPWFKATPIETNLPKFIRATAKEVIEKPEGFRGSYVRIEAESNSEETIGRLAEEFSFAYQIERQKEKDLDTASEVKVFLPEEVIKNYVKGQKSISRRTSKTLIRLGQKLFKGGA